MEKGLATGWQNAETILRIHWKQELVVLEKDKLQECPEIYRAFVSFLIVSNLMFEPILV